MGLAFRRSFEECYPWGVLVIGVVWSARRVPYDRNRTGRWVVVHFATGIASAWSDSWNNRVKVRAPLDAAGMDLRVGPAASFV